MEMYSRAVSEMYSQFKKEADPMEKYIGKLARCKSRQARALGLSGVTEVVGYSVDALGDVRLIADATSFGGWRDLGADDVVFKKCESYWFVRIDDLID